MAHEWFLTSDLNDPEHGVMDSRWREVLNSIDRLMVFVVGQADVLETALIEICTDMRMVCRLIPMDLWTNEASSVVVEFVGQEGRVSELFRLTLQQGDLNAPIGVELDLGFLKGRTGKIVVRPGDNCSKSISKESFGVVSFIVGRSDRLGLLEARTHRSWRIDNEIAHFSDVYSHGIYRQRNLASSETLPSFSSQPEWSDSDESGIEDDLAKWDDENVELCKTELAGISPQPVEDAYHYGMRLLSHLIPDSPPQFLPPPLDVGQKLRVLSICSGEAAIERQLFTNCMGSLDITLLDINKSLLEKAGSRFSGALRVKEVVGDVNDLPLFKEKFDIVIMVSALHHVVELELLASRVHRNLSSGGQFWVLGEFVGRRGNRLWPDAKVHADQIFSTLPKRYRKNYHSGIYDEMLPDKDCSAGCFEGIRSHDIRGVLQGFFRPQKEYLRNCFLWRFLDVAYASNYDLSKEEDLNQIRKLVLEEWQYWNNGGIGTEMFSIYSRKTD